MLYAFHNMTEMDIYARVKYNKSGELVSVVNTAVQPVALCGLVNDEFYQSVEKPWKSKIFPGFSYFIIIEKEKHHK